MNSLQTYHMEGKEQVPQKTNEFFSLFYYNKPRLFTKSITCELFSLLKSEHDEEDKRIWFTPYMTFEALHISTHSLDSSVNLILIHCLSINTKSEI